MKAKIPFGKKPKVEDDESEEIEEESADSSREDRTDATDISQVEEEEDDEPQSKSLVYKLKKKIQALQKKNVKLASKASDDDEVEEGAVDDEAAKKKKKSKMIQIAIGVCLVVFLASDYIIPTEEPVATPPALKKRPKPNKKVNPVDGTATDTTKKDETGTDVAVTGADTATDTAATTETTPDSPVTVTSDTPTDVPIDAASTDTTVTDTSTDTVPTDSTVTEPVTTDTTIDTAPTDTTDTSVVDSTTDTSVTEPSVDTSVNVDSVDGGETKTPGDDSITDQILQDLEKQAKDTQPVEQKKQYVSPPDYEYRGRGLVYNCQGKHWACVDAPSYKTCEDNSSSVKYLKKKTECYPFNVYETPRGCESMQNRMVSSSAKTQFCAD